MNWFKALYEIEDRGTVMSPEQRQSEARPIWNAMALWLEKVKLRTSDVILPKLVFYSANQQVLFL